MLLLATAVAATVAAQSTPAVTATATATVRIEHPVAANKADWDKLQQSAQHETIIHDEQGRPVLLRLIEMP